MKFPNVGVDVETNRVPSNEISVLFEYDDAFVPPLAIGRIPDTPVVRETCPPRVDSDRQLELIEKQPFAKFNPPVPWNVVVPLVTIRMFATENCDPGVDDPLPT